MPLPAPASTPKPGLSPTFWAAITLGLLTFSFVSLYPLVHPGPLDPRLHLRMHRLLAP